MSKSRPEFDTPPLWLAVQIAAVRIVILWTAMFLYTTTADWGQVVGYYGLIANSFIEMLLVRGFRGQEPTWTIALSVAVASTSMIAVYLWTRLATHLTRR